jgi:energy-coupling factor transporter ATP-binding protein EcfA2
MQPRTNPAPAGSVGITAWYAGGVASAGDTGSSPEIDGDFFGDDEGELTQAIPAVYDLRSRFTGRKEALATLERLFTAALTERTLGFAVVLGQPGMGKSRLVGEFARLARERTAEVRVLTGAAEEGGGPFHAVGRMLGQRFGIVARHGGGRGPRAHHRRRRRHPAAGPGHRGRAPPGAPAAGAVRRQPGGDAAPRVAAAARDPHVPGAAAVPGRRRRPAAAGAGAREPRAVRPRDDQPGQLPGRRPARRAGDDGDHRAGVVVGPAPGLRRRRRRPRAHRAGRAGQRRRRRSAARAVAPAGHGARSAAGPRPHAGRLAARAAGAGAAAARERLHRARSRRRLAPRRRAAGRDPAAAHLRAAGAGPARGDGSGPPPRARDGGDDRRDLLDGRGARPRARRDAEDR